MDFQQNPRPTRHPWTETENSLLYYWMEHDKVNHLSAKVIGEEISKEVEFLRSMNDPSISLPNQARKYTADAIKNRIDKMKSSEHSFHPLAPRNPARRIEKHEVNRNDLSFTNISFSAPQSRPKTQNYHEYAGFTRETPSVVAHSWMLPPKRQVVQPGNLVRQPTEECPDFYGNQEVVAFPETMTEPQNGGSTTQRLDEHEQDIISSSLGNPKHAKNLAYDFDEEQQWKAFGPILDFLGYPRSTVIPNPHPYPATTVVTEADRINPEMISIENTLKRAQVNHEWGMLLEQLGWRVPCQEPHP